MNVVGACMYQVPPVRIVGGKRDSTADSGTNCCKDEDQRSGDGNGPLPKILRRHYPHDYIPEIIPYGTFYIIGYNGFKPPFNRGRVRSYYQLIRKYYGDGVRYGRTYVAISPEILKAALAAKSHHVIYKFSVTETIIVQYVKDRDMDMFQFGRSAEAPIDFVVMDVDRPQGMASTVSRYACRLLADRRNFKDVRLFAAGFDEAYNIFLGEKAIKWQDGNYVDGITTNGILLSHPEGEFWGGAAKPGIWREVSVNGKLYTLRPSRDSDERGTPVITESNLLQDGSLIDLCGATLIWRSADGLKKSIPIKDLRKSVSQDALFKCSGMCKKSDESYSSSILGHVVNEDSKEECKPHVHLKCGHVESCFDAHRNYTACPVCLEVGPTARLTLGAVPAFYVDSGPLHYAFNPCGHIANQKTVEYWSNVKMPNRKSGFEAKCPFCATTLANPVGYVHLKQII